MAGGEILLVEGELDDKDEFFDLVEDGMSLYESCLGSPASCLGGSFWTDLEDRVDHNPEFNVWLMEPGSIQDRRDQFRNWMGFMSPRKDDEIERDGDRIVGKLDGDTFDSFAQVTSSGSENERLISSSSSGSSSSWESESPEDSYRCMIKNLDDGSVFVADEISQDGAVKRLRKLGSDQIITIDELHRSLESSFVQRMMRRDNSVSASSTSSEGSDDRESKGRRIGWLKRLGVVACVIDRQGPDNKEPCYENDRFMRNVVVHCRKKQAKEFSAVYHSQEIAAHRGAIWTMKFSPDGQYLASGGEDGIVRVWKITEHRLTNKEDALEKDPSYIYLKANSKLELSRTNIHMEKRSRLRILRSSPDSTFVVLPPKVFSIVEKPLHKFHGHGGDILSLSWSKNKYLVSSSTDKTVRLWQVGCETCLQVFSHNDYVTCVQFNPIMDNYFISGSIDGKVRIWDIGTCSVINWTDVKDMITAVCYKPDGKGVVVGTMAGNCRFYGLLDDYMHLDKEVSFHSKKKSSCKRITGFQFCPVDSQKLMVSSADSHIRILKGYEIVEKYKGHRNVGSQISASFTLDGRHIVSASEDSNVYIWNQNNHSSAKRVKSSSSYEHFSSNNVSVAIPWERMGLRNYVSTSEVTSSEVEVFRDKDKAKDGSPCCQSDFLDSSVLLSSYDVAAFSSTQQQFFADAIRRGSATWPEEQLLSSSEKATPAICKSRYRFLKPYRENKIATHSWGQVIVTAGWDGRIRVYHNYGLPARA